MLAKKLLAKDSARFSRCEMLDWTEKSNSLNPGYPTLVALQLVLSTVVFLVFKYQEMIELLKSLREVCCKSFGG